jgi:phosphate transport system permease protein
MMLLCILCIAAILAILAVVTLYLLVNGFSYLSWDIFTKLPIPPGMAGAPGGLKNALIGTGILVGLAGAVGIPLGMLAGIHLSEYSAGSWLGAPVRFIADVLAGVPSIVVGIVGYELVVVPMGRFNGYAGACALAFIMIPIVARTTEEMLRLVPNSYREASIALGATKARTILHVVLPAASGSIITGAMLAIARVAGETAPLLFTALGSRLLTLDPSQPFPSLTVQVFVYATGPYRDEQNLAWAGMLILIALVFLLNLALRLTIRHLQRSQPTGT